MKTALPILFFLLYAFCTQLPTLAADDDDVVRDINNQTVVPGQLYKILDAKNHSRGVETDEIGDQNCPISVIFGADPKKVIFHTVDPFANSIKTRDPLDIAFAEVSSCATSGHWAVEVQGGKLYPLVIGPPNGAPTMQGTFHINETHQPNVYNIAFNNYGINDYLLATKPYENNKAIYRVELCTDERFDVVFSRATDLVLPLPPPEPTSTFVPLIRKRVSFE